MRTLRAMFLRMVGVFAPRRDDFDEELAVHLEMHIEDGVRAGLSREEARRRALVMLGGVEQARQGYRERRGLPGLESFVRDLRRAVRTLSRHPAVTAIAILSIGLGIGANATIFSMVSRFVLQHPPVGNPASLLGLQMAQEGQPCCNLLNPPIYHDLRDQASSFSSMAAYQDVIPASISGGGDPERVWGQGVTTNFFDTLELPMVLGRAFTEGEDRAPVVVLSERLWQRRFNRDPQVVGGTIHLSGHQFTVVGIVPGAFHSVEQVLDMEFWVPLGTAGTLVPSEPPLDGRDWHWLWVVGRMRPGVTRQQVAAELNTLAQRFALNHPATDKGNVFVFQQAGSLPPRVRGGVLLFLALLGLVVVVLLAIAGMNVANLLFAQVAGRQRELAMHLALGASRGRLRGRLLMESVLLGVGGGVTGLLLSVWATGALSTFHLPAPVPLNARISDDWRTLVYTFVLSVLAGAALGVGPAWAASRPKMASALKGEDGLSGGGRRRFSVRNVLVVAQVAMSVTLLLLTGLFLRSLESAARIDIGFRSQGLALLSVDPRLNGYTAAQTSRLLAQLRERAAAVPGVDAAACTDVPLLSGGNRSNGFTVVGRSGKDNPFTYADLYMVTPGYLATVGTPLLAGHDFGAERADGPKTAIVDKAFADRLFHGANPIGQVVDGGQGKYEIIGVAGNAKSRTLGEDRPILYRSLDQSVTEDASLMGYTLVVHTKGDPSKLLEPLRRQVYALDPSMAIYNEETMEEHVRTAYFLPHVAAVLFGVFGFIGLVLATTGLYGVMNYAVSRRTREIGIRMALGARRGMVEQLFLRQGAVLTAIAIALGWPAAWMVSRLVRSFLYGVEPHDITTFVVVPVVLAGVALAACWVPARRAARVDPAETLRAE